MPEGNTRVKGVISDRRGHYSDGAVRRFFVLQYNSSASDTLKLLLFLKYTSFVFLNKTFKYFQRHN